MWSHRSATLRLFRSLLGGRISRVSAVAISVGGSRHPFADQPFISALTVHWKTNLIVTAVIAYLTLSRAEAPMEQLGFGQGAWILVQSVAIALVLTAAVHYLVRWRRNRRFRRTFEPRLRQFLQGVDADVQKAFQRLAGETSP